MSVSATDATKDAPITTSQAIAQLRSAGITLREETPGAESSIKRRDFPGPRKDTSRGRRVRRYHATVDPYMVKEEEEGSAEDPLEPLRRELSELKTEDEGLIELKPEPPQAAETPKHKRAKNKITLESAPPPGESRYAYLLQKSESEEETPEEQVNLDYLNMLHQRLLERDKERARKRLALPAFAQHTVPDEPPEVVAFFKDFNAVSSDEKIERWSRFKEEQKQYLATWKQESKAKRLAAQGRPEQASGSSRRVPTPPPPPAKPGRSLQGATSKAVHPRPAERSHGHWIKNLQDSRKIGHGCHCSGQNLNQQGETLAVHHLLEPHRA